MVEEAGHHSSKWPKKPRPQGSVETEQRQPMREGWKAALCLSSHNEGLCFRSLPVSQAPPPSVHLALLSSWVSGCLPGSCPAIPDEMSLLPWASVSLLPRIFPVGRALKP